LGGQKMSGNQGQTSVITYDIAFLYKYYYVTLVRVIITQTELDW